MKPNKGKVKEQKQGGLASQKRYELRCAVVRAVQRGEDIGVVARVFGVAVRSVFDWLAWHRQGGLHALREANRSGRPPKVGARVMRWLYKAITRDDPMQYQFEFCLWTLSLVRALLHREHGIVLSKSAASRLLKQLGLSPQRPIYKSYKQNPAQMRRYLEKTYPGLQEQARRTGAVIFFVDEAAVRSDAHRGTTWGKVGRTPVVRDSGERYGLRLISAVSPRGDMRFGVFEGKMNGSKFVKFIKKLGADVKRPVIIIADNASYHGSGPVRDCVEQSKGAVSVAHLPCYAPELNPDEQVWNHTKAQLGKRIVSGRAQMKRTVTNILRSIQRRADLVRSFFQLPDTRYASTS